MAEQLTNRRPTMVDVARSANVSLKTVSRVVNGVVTVDPELAERVRSAVSELGFRRNDMARSLRAGTRTASVGLLIEDIANPFYSSIAAGAADIAMEHNAMLLTASSEADRDRERRLLLAMCDRRVDGLLIVPTDGDHSYLDVEIAMGIPVVCLDRPAPGINVDCVVIDNRQGARSMIDHLMGQGHRRIGILAESLNIATMRERVEAVEDALTEAGIGVDPDLVRTELHVPGATARAIDEMLALPDPPTAFMCMNNRNTIGAIGALERAGSDSALAGFDDFETSAIMPRPLTLVTYDAREMGRRAAQMLFWRIGGAKARRRRVVIPTTLEQRGIQR